MLPSITEFNPYTSLLDATKSEPPGGGTDRQAIEFAINELEDFEALSFLKDWLKGDLSSWPEFGEHLKGAPSGSDDQV